MRKAFLLTSLIVLLLLMPLVVTNVASSDVNEIANAAYINITVEEAKQMMDENQNIVILDVRTLAEYKSGHIDGAESLPLSEMGCAACLHARLDNYTDKDIIVYCESGVKCEDAGNILVNHEFEKVYKMMGGVNAWVDAGFPVVSDSTSSEIDYFLHSNKSVFLFLYVDWCHFCQQQMPIIDELEQEYAEKIAFVRINCEEHPNAMTEFGASGYPSMFLIPGKGDDGQYEFRDFRGFTDKETLKESIDWITTNRGVDESISLSWLKPLMFTSVASATNLCETDPSQCQCSVVTCANACAGYSISHDCEHYCLDCALGNVLKCVACVACVGFEIGEWLGCAVLCQADPCQYGYECTPPCSPVLDNNGRYVYVCFGYTRKAKFCSCDGQDWDWSEVACPSGKSCCYNSAGDVVCVDLQSDIYNCGECLKECRDATLPACCSGDCKDLWKDRYNCGSCGKACGEDYWDCDGNDRVKWHCSCVGGSFYWEVIGDPDPCLDKECVKLPGKDSTCEEVPEFPAGVTAVFGATFFIFLMMRRKYVER